MPQENPLIHIYNESVASSNMFSSVSDDKRQRLANETIENYLKEHSSAQDIKDINAFIKTYNSDKSVPDKNKISYDVIADDKGNVYAHQNHGEDKFVKIHAPKNEVTWEIAPYINSDSKEKMHHFAEKDGIISPSEKKLLAFVDGLRDSMFGSDDKNLSREKIQEAYNIIAADKKITPSEKEMFDELIKNNNDLGASAVKGLKLFYNKDAPIAVPNPSTGEISTDLFMKYSGDDHTKILSSTAAQEPVGEI